jgi:hypothetical protein
MVAVLRAPFDVASHSLDMGAGILGDRLGSALPRLRDAVRKALSNPELTRTKAHLDGPLMTHSGHQAASMLNYSVLFRTKLRWTS